MVSVLKFKFDTEESVFCCGLSEIGDFRVEAPNEWDNYYEYGEKTEWPPDSKDKGVIATTTGAQKGSARQLKEMGFKKLGTWTRDSGVKLTLWGWFPKRRKKRGTKK